MRSGITSAFGYVAASDWRKVGVIEELLKVHCASDYAQVGRLSYLAAHSRLLHLYLDSIRFELSGFVRNNCRIRRGCVHRQNSGEKTKDNHKMAYARTLLVERLRLGFSHVCHVSWRFYLCPNYTLRPQATRQLYILPKHTLYQLIGRIFIGVLVVNKGNLLGKTKCLNFSQYLLIFYT